MASRAWIVVACCALLAPWPALAADDSVITARTAEAPPRPPAARDCRTRGTVEAGIAIGGGTARHLGARLDYGQDVSTPAGVPLPPCAETGVSASLEIGQTSGDIGRGRARRDAPQRPPPPR